MCVRSVANNYIYNYELLIYSKLACRVARCAMRIVSSATIERSGVGKYFCYTIGSNGGQSLLSESSGNNPTCQNQFIRCTCYYIIRLLSIPYPLSNQPVRLHCGRFAFHKLSSIHNISCKIPSQ